MDQFAESGESGGPKDGPDSRTVLLAAGLALLAILLLAGAFLFGQSMRESNDDVQQMVDTQAQRDHRFYTRQRVKAVVVAKQNVRDTWQHRARKDAKVARAEGESSGYQSGSAQGYASGHDEGKSEGEVEGYGDAIEDFYCYDEYGDYIC